MDSAADNGLSYALGSPIAVMTEFHLIDQTKLANEIMECGLENLFQEKDPNQSKLIKIKYKIRTKPHLAWN